MNKISIVFIAVSLILVLGCAPQVETPPSRPSGSAGPEGSLKEFTITAKRFEFNPSAITVQRGDKVKLTITSIDAAHGFYLPDFNIDKKLEQNNPVVVEFVVDKSGEFEFRCNIPCGSGHGGMKGTLTVE